MHTAFKYRIYPTESQQSILTQDFGNARALYNHLLYQHTQSYNAHLDNPELPKPSTSKFSLINQVPALKAQYDYLKLTYSKSLQDVAGNLANSFDRFFKGTSKHPKYKKSKDSKQSISFDQQIKITPDGIKVPGKIGLLKTRFHRELPLEYKICKATISREPNNEYYIALIIKTTEEYPETSTEGGVIGIDLGITDIYVDSNGNKTGNPKHTKRNAKNLKRKSQKLARKRFDRKTRTGSRNREKARIMVAKIHAKIRRARKDFQHKLACTLVRENQTVVCENLAVKNMIRNRKLSKAIQDASWYQFKTILIQKLDKVGGKLIEIGRYFPSTHMCAVTGDKLPKMKLSVREFVCPSCGEIHDRDTNAAKNILNEGLRIMAV